MFHLRFRPSSRLCCCVSLVPLCFAITFILLHIERAIHSFPPHASCLPRLRRPMRPSLTLKPSTVTLVLEVPSLTTLRAPQVARDLTPVTVCVCVYSPHSTQLALDSRPVPSVVIYLCFVVGANIRRSMKGKVTTEGLGRTEPFLSRSA